MVVGWVRLGRNAVRCWIAYLRHIRPAVSAGDLVVGDRWIYGYLVQPEALRFSGPEVLARGVIAGLPRPDLVVNLAASPDVVRSRKRELSAAAIARELETWASLGVNNLHTIDATQSPDAIADTILALVQARG